ncbi:MAG: cupin domain-containing protein [Pyrinomonadaceae bacterium]
MEEITCINLDETIEQYTKQLGYRLDMIFPADAPREALLSNDGVVVRLVVENHPAAEAAPLLRKEGTWIRGRAGMEYRALSPRFSGQPPKGGTPSSGTASAFAAHHIRLTKGGEVPDYVHYHKVDFQMIYCVKGRIKVVYEDQGEPFWLETGDCVLQPPEIRHRVLYADAGAEVIEVSMPAEHETWVEHKITLPTSTLNPMREFSGQRFVRHIAAENIDQNGRDLGISAATGGRCKAFVQKITTEDDLPANDGESGLFFRLNDSEILAVKLNM